MKGAIICFPKIDWQVQFPIGIYKIKSYSSDIYQIFIVDGRLCEEEPVIEQLLAEHEILCLGLSVMTGQQISGAIRISKWFHGKIPIVWGGVHPTISPDIVLKQEYVDCILRGDGEASFRELLEELDANHGVLVRKKSDQRNYEVSCFKQLDSSVIDFEQVELPSEYFVKRDGFQRAFPLETSRGCPHQCAFCHNAILGHQYRVVDTKYTQLNISALYQKYHIDGIIFQEDNFFLRENRVFEMLHMLKQYHLGWKANSRISYFKKLILNRDFLQLLQDTHCHVLQFGIESGCERILQLIQKRISLDDVVEVNKALADCGISIRYNFIIGFPTETEAEIEQTLNFIERLRADNRYMEPPFVNIYTPYPGTPLYHLALECGFQAPQRLEEWARIVWNTPDESLNTPHMCQKLYEISQSFLEKTAYPR